MVLIALGVTTAAVVASCATGTAETTNGLLPEEAPTDFDASTDAGARDGGPRRVTEGGGGDPGADGSVAPDASGADGGNPDGGGGGGDGGTTSCGPVNTCPNATNLGTVRGDTGSDVVSATGYQSQWLFVNVTEADSGFPGSDLYMVAQLTSPPGVNFDLFIYEGNTNPPLQCSSVKRQSTSTAALDEISHSWGEGFIPNGSDDSKLITIEVRWVSGTCDPSKKWSLTVYGNAI
jgi:hypothetical protein